MDDTTATRWAIDELVRLIEIPSISDHEHEAMSYLAARCLELDLPAETQPIPGAGPNVVVRWSDHPALLLTAHVDTIVPTWIWDGHARAEGSVVYGLGAQDDKGCVVAILLGALMAHDEGAAIERLPVALGFCVDEEVRGKGSKAMADTLRPTFVVASEGTELDTAVVETGFVDGVVTVSGTSIHGSLAEEGRNAIEAAARLIIELLDAPFTTFEHPIAGRNVLSVRRFRSSEPSNAIPDHAEFAVAARIFGHPEPEAVAEQIAAICRRHGAVFRTHDTGGWWETAADAPLVRALASASERTLGRRPKLTRMPAWTDAHSFADRCDSEVVVFGPGHLRAAHRPDEHIDVREVVKCARVFARLIAEADALAAMEPSGSRRTTV
jgi:acetylornithine deacetylase/succinyl-diaminopimelate desuccinylase-like protein